MDISLNIKGLTKAYGDKLALDNFTFDFSAGIYGILGANGAGKSTLFNLITDNVKRDGGQIFYNGKEILTLGADFRGDVGYMPQSYGLYEDFSPVSFLLYMAELKGIGRRRAKEQIGDLLKFVNLEASAKKKIGSFSGGMKQRVHLANALLGEPKVIILDEPTVGLDPNERLSFRNMLKEISGNRIIIYSTHIVGDAESISDKILIMDKGTLKKEGSRFQLISEIRNKVFERSCDIGETEALRKAYPVHFIRQSEKGLLFRVVADCPPEGFYAADRVCLEDVYFYCAQQLKR